MQVSKKSKVRIQLDQSASYQVMNRTIQGLFLWDQNNFRQTVYERIRFFCRVYYVKLREVCVMSNRYHVVLDIEFPELDAKNIRERYELFVYGRNPIVCKECKGFDHG